MASMNLVRNQLLVVLMCLVVLSPANLAAAAALREADPPATSARFTYAPLSAPAPAWFTPEVQDKTIAAGKMGFAYNFETDELVPLQANGQEDPLGPNAGVGPNYLQVRPGALLIGEGLSVLGVVTPQLCTLGFVTGDPTSYRAITAGHCSVVGDHPIVVMAPQVLLAFGETVESHYNPMNPDYSRDYAIIQINDSVLRAGAVNPTVAVIGGPEGGVYTGSLDLDNPQIVKHIGHGYAVGAGGTPRLGVATHKPSDGEGFFCECVFSIGDSGSPALVVTSENPLGQALGILTAVARPLLEDGPFQIAGDSRGAQTAAGTLLSPTITSSVADGRLPPEEIPNARVCSEDKQAYAKAWVPEDGAGNPDPFGGPGVGAGVGSHWAFFGLTGGGGDGNQSEPQGTWYGAQAPVPWPILYDDVNNNRLVDDGERIVLVWFNDQFVYGSMPGEQYPDCWGNWP